jgi:hypothetical protein
MTLLLLFNPVGTGTPYQLLPEASFEMSTLEVANKVFVAVSGSSPLTVGSATNTTVAPTYATAPRETLILIDSGDVAKCNTVSASQLALRQVQRKRLTGIPIRLRDGLAIQRGEVVRIVIPRAGINANYPVRRIAHDFGSNTTTIDVGEYASARDDAEAVLSIASAIAQLQKETSI